MSIYDHMPTFHYPTEWEASRTAPCQAVCVCGWTSEVVRDQTTAEWIHGQHLELVGELPTPPLVAGEES